MRLTRLEGVLLFFFALGLLLTWIVPSPSDSPSSDSIPQETEVQPHLKLEEKIREAVPSDPEEVEAWLASHPELKQRLGAIALVGFGLMVVSIWAFFRVGLRLFLGRPIFAAMGEPPPPRWGLRQIIRLSLGIFVLLQWLGFLMGMGMVFFGSGQIDEHLISLGTTLWVDGMVIAVVLGWMGGADVFQKASWSQTVASIRLALGAYVSALPVLCAVLLLVVVLVKWMAAEPPPQPVVTMYLSENRQPVLSWLILLVAVGGPVAEELFFRGLLYGWLRTRIRRHHALLFTAFLFALLHAHWVAFLPIFFLGLLFGWVYERTGSLAAPIAIHVVHNTGMIFLASLLKSILSIS